MRSGRSRPLPRAQCAGTEQSVESPPWRLGRPSRRSGSARVRVVTRAPGPEARSGAARGHRSVCKAGAVRVVVVGAGLGRARRRRTCSTATATTSRCSRRRPSRAASCAGPRSAAWWSTSGPRRCSTRVPRASRSPPSSGSTSCTRRCSRRGSGPAARSARCRARSWACRSTWAELRASGVLSDGGAGSGRVPSGPACPVDGDLSVGDLVASRLGDEVVDRLVEPLLGGVYAGHARRLSARATVPQLVALAQRGPLLGAELPSTCDRPVFAGLPGGMARLHRGAGGRGADADRRHGPRAAPAPGRASRSSAGPTDVARSGSRRDAVVLATPAAPDRPAARRRGAGGGRRAGRDRVRLGGRRHAARSAPTDVRGLDDSSGFLVPPVDGRAIKASTFSFAKWAWVREAGRRRTDLVHLRTSLGRHGEEATLQRTDEELVAASLADLAEAAGLRAGPVDDPRAAMGRRAAAVRRRPPRPGRPDPGRGRRRAGAGGLRGGVRRRRHPGRHRLGPPRRWRSSVGR